MIVDKSRGFIYVAWGPTFIAEAVVSAAQVRRVMGLPIVLVTHEDVGQFPEFDDIIYTPFSHTYRDKILMRLSPFEHTIFLDTDTFVIDRLDDVFTMLERFDLVYQPSAPSMHYRLPGVPMLAFEEPSAGIIAWRRNDSVKAFFDRWATDYDFQEVENGNGAWDQRSMRSALWSTDIKIFGLGRDWQLYSFEPSIAMNTVRMVHGRGKAAIAAVNHSNRRVGPRLYLPGIGFHFLGGSPIALLWLSFRAAYLAVKRTLRLSLHYTGVWKLPRNKRPM